MADLDLKLDGIANGLLVEQTDKKKADADKKKRMYASAFAYIRNQTGMNKRHMTPLVIPAAYVERSGQLDVVDQRT